MRYNRVKFAYHFHINHDLNLKTAEFLAFGLCDFGETLSSARPYVTDRFSRKNATTAEFRHSAQRGVAL